MAATTDEALVRQFGAEDFDAVAWAVETLAAAAVGAAAGDAAEAALEQAAARWVTRLQRISQDVGQRLDDATTEASSNIPKVLTDIELLKRDALAMREAVGGAHRELDIYDDGIAGVLSTLAELDRVKHRLEDCQRALVEAENWNKLSTEIEHVFEAGDLRGVADKLGEMSRSLQVFRNLPQYEAHRDTLALLQNRFHAALSPQVMTALASYDSGRCAELYSLFRQFDRTDEYAKLYIKARRATLAKAWTDTVGGAAVGTAPTIAGPAGARVLGRLAENLAHYWNLLVTAAQKELAWLHAALPNEAAWAAALVTAVLGSLEPPLRSCVAKAVEETRRPDEELLGVMHAFQAARAAAARLDAVLSPDLPAADVDAALTTFLQLFRPWMAEYAELERRLLLNQLQAINLRRLALLDTIHGVAEAVPRILAMADAVPDRARQLGRAALLPGAADALDTFFDATWERFRGVLQYLRKTARHQEGGVAATATTISTPSRAPEPAAPFEQDWSVCQGAISFLVVCVDLAQRLQRLQAALSDKSTDGNADGNTPRVMRIHDALAASVVEEKKAAGRGPGLEKALAGLTDLTSKVQAFLFDGLFESVRVSLDAMSTLPQWNASGAAQPVNPLPGVTEMPAFSLAPSPYITAIGEHLLTLPQQLESYSEEPALEHSLETLPTAVAAVAAAEDGPGSIDRTELWIRGVSTAALTALIDRILRIPRLSEAGRQQLLTDLRYFRNVLSALDVVESETFVQLVRALQDPLAEVHLSVPSLPPAEQAVAARIASLRALSTAQ